MDLGTLVAIGTRAQQSIEHAMEAAFGTALVVVSTRRTDHDAPFTRSIIPEFEKQYARLVVPVFEAIYPDDRSKNEVYQFLVGGFRNDAIEANRRYFIGRVERLIEKSNQAAKTQGMRDSAPLN